MKRIVLAVSVLVVSGISAQASEVFDQNLVHGVYYGTGNGLSPENFATVNDNSIELGLRAKLTTNFNGTGFEPPHIDGANGTYVVPLGDQFNFDFSVDPTVGGSSKSLAGISQLLTITNELTGATFSADPSLAVFGNATLPSAPGAYQNSEKIIFFPALGYDPNVNDIYQITLTVGDLTDTIDVQIGAGLTAAVPEPGTWAMMMLGFCGVGFMAYRRKQASASFRLA
jgi:PEP-CTERM motif